MMLTAEQRRAQLRVLDKLIKIVNLVLERGVKLLFALECRRAVLVSTGPK